MALFASAPGWAADLRLALGAQGEYDSNVFRRDTDVEDDFVIVAVPDITLLDTEGKFTYDVGYSFPYQHSIQTNALRDFNHVARVGADYHLSDRTQFSFTDRLSYEEALSDNFDETPTIADDETQQRVLRNRADLRVDYRVMPRLSSNSSFGQDVFSTTQDNRSNNRTYSLATALNYDLTERQTLGGGIGSTYQDFDESDDDPASHSIFVGPFLAWSYRIDEQSELRVHLGPSYVYSKAEAFTPASAPPVPADSDHRIAALGRFTIDRRWNPTMLSGFSYERQQDTASGVSGSAILDAVSLTHTWALSERWSLALRADWTQRKSATSVQTGDDDLDTQRWGAGAVVAYRMLRNLTGSVRYQYGDQHSQASTAGRFSDYNGHVVSLGLNYALDPIEVW